MWSDKQTGQEVEMNNTGIRTLRVPGATLAYEVRGAGPLLLLMPGGGNDARAFAGIVPYLVDQYTVVTYSRRGLGPSTLDDPQEAQRVATQSDDAARLLDAVGRATDPALVFGSSGGGLVGLDLVARHPQQVRTLIAHEPPTHLAPQADPIREMGAVVAVYRREGVMPALQTLMAQPGLSQDGREPDSAPPAMTPEERAQSINNLIFLFEREYPMFDQYALDFAALQQAATTTRIVIASGRVPAAAEYWSARAVAARLGTAPVEFPGGHVGYLTHPRAFTQQLRALLAEHPGR
jgi:pimeloyl-ACP methyl ester carboxylesterase